VEVAHSEVVVADVAEGWAGRGVDVEASFFAELADAKKVGGVGDDDDVVKIVFVGDGCKAVDLLLGIDGVGFGDDTAEGNSVCEKIVAADATFRIAGVFIAAAAQGDDEWSNLLAVEFDGVIEAGVKDWGWVAEVFGCSKDGDGVSGLGFVVAGDCCNLLIHPDAPGHEDQQNHPQQTAEEGTAGCASTSQIGGRGDHTFFATLTEELV